MVDSTRPVVPVAHTDGGEHRRQIANAVNLLSSTTPNYRRTTAEIAADVQIADGGYPEGHILRYGRNETPGTTDMAPALNNAIKVAAAGGCKSIYIPTGTYLLESPVGPESELFGLEIYGDGSLATTLRASHSDGPVLTFNRSTSKCRKLTVTATSARTNGSASSSGSSWNDNVGVLFEPPDETSKAIASCYTEDLRILSQPSHGFVAIGLSQVSVFTQLLVQSNKGHGAVFDRGTLTGRTNQANPGIITLINFWAIDNGGNGLVGGHPNDTAGIGAFRFLMHNPELDGNATDSDVYHTAHQMWLRSENSEINLPAFGGDSATGGLRFSGRDLLIMAPRSINCTHFMSVGPDEVNDQSLGIEIHQPRIIGTAQDPVIVNEDITKVRGIRVYLSATSNITSLFTAGSIQCVGNLHEPVTIVRKTSNQSVNETTTLDDDDELQIPIAASETVTFQAYLRYTGSSSADIKFAVVGPSGTTVRWQPVNSIYVDSSDTVSVNSTEITESGTLAFGADSGTRIAQIAGTATASTTSGMLKIQFAQQSAVASDTTVLAQSTFTVFRDNATL